MELLDEYQNASKTIQKLEEQLADIKEAVEVVSKGLNVICKDLKQSAEIFDDSKEPVIKRFVEQSFTLPTKMLEMLVKTLNIPFMNEEHQKEAKKEIILTSMELLKSKVDLVMSSMEK